MFFNNIFFNRNFFFKTTKVIYKKTKDKFFLLKNEFNSGKLPFLSSFNSSYKLNYSKNIISNLKKNKNFTIVGMGGSILGSKAIYSFLKNKVKKNFNFIDNLSENNLNYLTTKKKQNYIFISKSGNTLETLVNLNAVLKNKKFNNFLFITEKKNNSLLEIANKFKSEVIEHKDFIGGRYSVMSEVGMLPAQLMNLNIKKFKNLNSLIKNKNFQKMLNFNVASIYSLISKNKTNSIILNYDPDMNDFCYWYQQLIAESLGKHNKGIMPIISIVPKDNHSLFQYYLDGKKNAFYTIFFSNHLKNKKIYDTFLPNKFKYLSNKSYENVINAQRIASERVFTKKKIPFRSFLISKKSEEELGILFTFCVLETILLAKLIKVNPFDQPAVELIKKNTKKILLKIK